MVCARLVSLRCVVAATVPDGAKNIDILHKLRVQVGWRVHKQTGVLESHHHHAAGDGHTKEDNHIILSKAKLNVKVVRCCQPGWPGLCSNTAASTQHRKP